LPSKYTSAVFNQDLSDHCRNMKLFSEVRNQFTQSVRKAKTSFFKRKFASCSTNSKRFWDTKVYGE
jgi:hypothetical protein